MKKEIDIKRIKEYDINSDECLDKVLHSKIKCTLLYKHASKSTNKERKKK